MIPLIQSKRAEVAELCEKYGVERLDLFESASSVDNAFDPDASDLDFVVSFERRDPPTSSAGTSGLRRIWSSCSGAKWTW